MTDAQWDATRRANLDSVLYVCRAAIPLLPDGGKIVLVSSTAGQRGEPFHADYAATKGAVISFTKSLAVELAPRRINVNCVAPGWVDTEMSATPYARDAGRGKEDIERTRSEEHTSELQSQSNLVCRLLLEKKKNTDTNTARVP